MLGDFQYVTLTIIYCEIEACKNELMSFLTDDNSNDKYVIATTGRPNAKDIYFPSPPGGGAQMDKFLLWEPSNIIGKTVFFANSPNGRYNVVFNYCKKFKRKAVNISFSNFKQQYPAFKFYYLDFSNKNIERTISLIKDGRKWEFFTSGDVQKFEELRNYANVRAVKRFNKETILEYLLRLEIDISDDNFWRSLKEKHSYYIDQTRW
jgi:hypothetical protein